MDRTRHIISFWQVMKTRKSPIFRFCFDHMNTTIRAQVKASRVTPSCDSGVHSFVLNGLGEFIDVDEAVGILVQAVELPTRSRELCTRDLAVPIRVHRLSPSRP